MLVERYVVLAMGLWLIMEAGAACPESRAQEPKGATQADDRDQLPGTWAVTKVNIGGKDVEDRGFSGATFTFRGGELTIASPHEPAEKYAIGLEGSAVPRLMSTKRVGAGAGPSGWMIYAFVGPTLKIAFHETLQEKPKGFDPGEGLIILDLARQTSSPDPAPEPATASRRVVAHPQGCWFALFSPDGQTLATGGHDALVRLWDVATLTPKKTFRGLSAGVTSGAFSPDGKILVAGESHGRVLVVDLAKNAVVTTIRPHTKAVRAVAFSPDGKTLATCSDDKTIQLWDSATWKLLRKLPEQAQEVKWVAFSPDGKTLASVTGHFKAGDLTLWDPTTGTPRQTIPFPLFAWMFVFSPDGQTLAIAGHGPGLHYFDVATGLPRSVLPLQSMTRPMAYSPDGKLVAVGRYRSGVEVLDAASGRIRWKLTDVGPNLFRLAFSPDGKTLAIAGEDGSFTLQDLSRTPEADSPPVTPPQEK